MEILKVWENILGMCEEIPILGLAQWSDSIGQWTGQLKTWLVHNDLLNTSK